MSETKVAIRRLVARDAALYREIRLEALANSPEAFSSSLAAEAARPLAWFEERLAGSQVFGALREGILLGIAGFHVEQGEKVAHKAVLWGTYVRPAARRLGIAGRLLRAVVEAARRQVELLQLAVVSDNEVAKGLYARFGFAPYGLEPRAMKIGDRYFDELLMALSLEPYRQ